MQKLLLIVIIMAFSALAEAQVTPKTIAYDTVITKTANTKTFYVRNPSNKTIQITNVRTVTGKFYFSLSPFNINPNDSVLVTVYFNSPQNITHKDFLIFEDKGLNCSIIYYGLCTAKFPESYYLPTQNLWDEALKSAIRTYTTTGYVTLGYNTARDYMFASIDKYLTNDTIECVYTGYKVRAVNRTEAQNQGFNTEHTFPQSFFNSNDPMVSDLFHLYPTLDAPNSCRSNYDFNKVFTITSTSCNVGGSKLGTDSTGETVYEPRDKHKGNVARSLFYFSVKYNNISPGGYMDVKQENRLRLWNYFDTADANERLRNTRIANYQHVRNPFIDHPELIDRIASTFSVVNRTPTGKISATPYTVTYDTLRAGDTSSYLIGIMNYGTANLTISNAISSNPQFTVVSTASPIAAGQFGYIRVKFSPTATYTTYNGTLTVSNSDSTIVINLKGVSSGPIGVQNISGIVPKETKLFQNYPNPFNPTTNIRFQLKNSGFVSLKVYDVLGQEIAALVNENMNAGTYEMLFDGSGLTSGVYYYKLESNGYSSTNKLIIIK